MALHAVRTGDPHGIPPLVLLHGFGGFAGAWQSVVARLPLEQPTIAYDLPGHGLSIHADGIGHAGDMAKALLADLAGQGISRFHVVGHSMGGAIAALMAIRVPTQVMSLTMLAPGGFGPAINHRALRRLGEAVSVEELRLAMEPMIGFNSTFPEDALVGLAKARQLPGAIAALRQVLGSILIGSGQNVVQGVLPAERLRGLDMPIGLLWGEEDMVLPVGQSQLPSEVADIRRLDGVGHMLIEEAPDAVLSLISDQLARA